MLRTVSLSILAAFTIVALAAPADAKHRWRRHHTFFPLIDVFPGGWDEEDEYAYLYDEDEDNAAVSRRLQRNLRAEDQWWLHEDDESLEPVLKKPAKKKLVKKKKAIAAVRKPPKPVAKPSVLTASASATEMSSTATAKKVVAVEKKPEVKSTTPLATAKAAPPTDAKTIGCTAGAAVVTGYGFGEVKPKSCTGDTYSYTASRGGKSFLIKLTASSGEVVDVKKL